MKVLRYSSVIQLPVEKINLYEWIINVSDKEYQRFSKGHRAMGLFKGIYPDCAQTPAKL